MCYIYNNNIPIQELSPEKMKKETLEIPFYGEINDFLASVSLHNRTQNPLFYCLRLKPNDDTIQYYKPLFKKNFYFISLITNSKNTKIIYDTTKEEQLDSFLVFQSPNQIYSFHRDNNAQGYLIYFKKELFDFYKPHFDKEFPFFDILKTNFFKIDSNKFKEFAPHFEYVFEAYDKSPNQKHQLSIYRFLALLFQLKEFTNAYDQWETSFNTPQQLLYKNFMRLLNKFYIEKRTVEDYALLLHVTANHLSKTIKNVSGQNALSLINERILAEAKSLIHYTDNDMAQIAYQLNFSDPANFGKFFKKHTLLSPLEYKKSSQS